MNIKKLVVAVSAAAMMSGCASILTDETKSVNVATSTGKQIEVTIDGTQHTVPGIVMFQKDGTDKIITTADDTCTKQTAANKKIEGAFWVNLLSGGLFGSTTDNATNKMWTYEDNVTISCQ